MPELTLELEAGPEWWRPTGERWERWRPALRAAMPAAYQRQIPHWAPQDGDRKRSVWVYRSPFATVSMEQLLGVAHREWWRRNQRDPKRPPELAGTRYASFEKSKTKVLRAVLAWDAERIEALVVVHALSG